MTIKSLQSPPLITSRAAAFALNLWTNNHVHALAQQRYDGPSAEFTKLGREVRYDPREVERYRASAADDTVLTLDDVSDWYRISKEAVRFPRDAEYALPWRLINGRLETYRRDAALYLRSRTVRPSRPVRISADVKLNLDTSLGGLRYVPLITPAETARLLKRNVGTLENWRAADRGPEYIKLGPKSVMYDRQEVIRYVRALGDMTPLTLDQVAHWWAVSPLTVGDLCRQANGPKIRRVNGRSVIHRGAADIFLRSLVSTPIPRRSAAA